MNVDDLEILVEAVRSGSLVGAARRLRLTSMNVTRRLAALEAELGVRLLHRTTRAVGLTPEGETFLPFAEAMIEQAATSREALRPAGDGAQGLLRVTASIAFGRLMVAPMVPTVLAANPGLSVDLILTDGIVDIVADGVDLAFRIGTLRDNSLVARKIASNRRVLCATPEYLERRGAPQKLADLPGHECLTLGGFDRWDFRHRTTGEALAARVHGRFSANSYETLHDVCRGGLGIAYLSHWFAAEDLVQGHLVALRLSDALPEENAIWAVHPTRGLVPAKVRVFTDALQQHFLAQMARHGDPAA
jgi:DNA-binding transcriptional LysR family regulator